MTIARGNITVDCLIIFFAIRVLISPISGWLKVFCVFSCDSPSCYVTTDHIHTITLKYYIVMQKTV